MFGIGPWQDGKALHERLVRLRDEAAGARRSRLCQKKSGQAEAGRRGYWCLCIRMPRLLPGGRNG